MTDSVVVMGWNVENFGASKWNHGGDKLLDIIAKVMFEKQVQLAAFSEIRSKLGDKIGKALAAKLGASWTHKASPPYGKGRWEQYLFVWNTSVVDTYATAAAPTSFLDTYDDPAAPGKRLGFPRGVAIDRPPYAGFFETVANRRKLVVAVLHSPKPTPPSFPTQAAQQVAKVTPFRSEGDACVVLGDFNIKNNVLASVAGSNGAAAFTGLVQAKAGAAATGMAQVLVEPGVATGGILSSLKSASQAFAHMDVADALSEPYDQIFLRPSPGASPPYSDEVVEELISESTSSPPGYIHTEIQALIDALKGPGQPPITTTEDAFRWFRYLVSDHHPVLVKVEV